MIEAATLCAPRRDTIFAQPVKLAGAGWFFGSGGGRLELVSRPPPVEKGTIWLKGVGSGRHSDGHRRCLQPHTL